MYALIAFDSWRNMFIILLKIYYFLLEKGASMAEIVGRRKVIYHKKGHMTCMMILMLHVRHVFKGEGFNKKRDVLLWQENE